MTRTSVRAAAAALATCGVLLLAGPWQAAQAAPVVLHKASSNGPGDEADRFTVVLGPGSDGSQAQLQLFTAAGPGSRISGLYLQDGTGAVARDIVSGDPLLRLAPPTVYEVLLADPGAQKVAVVKALSSALGISLGAAKDLVDRAPTVIRTGTTPEGQDGLKQSLESLGARVTLGSRQNPAVPVGANAGVGLQGAAATGYDVVLAGVGSNKLAIVKLVSDLTGLGLAEAKKLVDELPSVLRGNASAADALAMQQALQDSGATVALQPIGGGAGQGPLALPPGSAGIVPDIGVGIAYEDPDATPALQLSLDLDVAFADFWTAWQRGRLLLALEVTDASGVSDLYLASGASPPAAVSEPPTVALVLLALAGFLGRARQVAMSAPERSAFTMRGSRALS